MDVVAPALEARGRAAQRLETIAQGTGVVVTTGQQPGLYGGPLYTLTKALGARALADALQDATGFPVAPIFWAATDDADFAEASSTVVALDRGPVELRAKPTAPEGTPMSAVPLGPDVPPMLRVLAEASGSAAFIRALEAAESAYRAGNTVGAAYVALLRDLLEPLGVAVLDASHHAVREAGFHTMRRAMLQAADIERAVQARAEAIRAAGFTPQVDDVNGLSLVFRYDADGRKTRVPITEARSLVTQVRHPELSPNVLLRPIVERAIVPTVAYLAGPGELAYFAQVSAVASALNAAPPLAVPRWSATIVEPHVRRALDRLGIDVEDLADPHAVETRLAKAALPNAIVSQLEALRAAIDEHTGALEGDGDATALVPAQVIEGTRRLLRFRLDRLERRYTAAIKRTDERTARDVALVRGALYPFGVRQERALNALPMLARLGPVLWDRMLVQARQHADALVETGRSPLASR
jgi:bacillithiol biosynthesis cysteine-adding enzyme BshC